MQHCNPKTLNFDQVQYPVETIQNWLNDPRRVDKFTFVAYLAPAPGNGHHAPSLELAAYAYSIQDGYLNADEPNILVSCTNNTPLPVEGPAILSTSMLNATDVSNYLANHPTAQYLIFTPKLDGYNRLKYDIKADSETSAAAAKVAIASYGDGGLETNPSPPATTVSEETLV